MINWIFANNTSIGFQDCVGKPESYLDVDEQTQYGKIKIPKRKAEWLFSRWVCKRLVKASLDLPVDTSLRAIAIRKLANGVPFVDIAGIGQTGWLSLSHSNNGVLAAFSKDSSCRFGVDLELIEERSLQLIEDYFTAKEGRWVNSVSGENKIFRTNLIWSAKEAYLKAMELGLQIDTRQIEISPAEYKAGSSGWHETGFCVDSIATAAWRLYFRREAGFVLTMCLPAEKVSKLSRFYLG